MSEAEESATAIRVGVPEFDAEHADLQARTRLLEEAVHRGAPVEKLLNLLDEVIQGALEHFEHEEAELADVNFPGLDDHIRGHNRLLRVLLHLKSDLREQRYRPEVAVRFIHAWHIEHIREMDTQYMPYFTPSPAT